MSILLLNTLLLSTKGRNPRSEWFDMSAQHWQVASSVIACCVLPANSNSEAGRSSRDGAMRWLRGRRTGCSKQEPGHECRLAAGIMTQILPALRRRAKWRTVRSSNQARRVFEHSLASRLTHKK